MVFANLIFLFVFLPLNILLYYGSGNRTYRNVVLVAFSLFFYAWGEPVWILLLVFTASVDYFLGLFIERFSGTAKAKTLLIFAVIFNLGLLGLFKYSGFLYENINALLGVNLAIPSFTLPIGISFYTFQTLSYLVDVYRGEVKAQKSYLKFLMFVSLYHQLVAGPILRYSYLAAEIEDRKTDIRDISAGVTRFCVGLFKKVAVANVAGNLLLSFMGADLSRTTVLGSWAGAIFYTLQIYYDFSGYSDMAIGLGMMFGFHYEENFNYPYIAKTATDFWRRWHISLSSFFRDYLYIPLGGNRSHVYRNLLIVWFCTGLWHGASWNFIIWGLFFGVLIMLERSFLGALIAKLPAFVGHLYMFIIIPVSWVLFYFTDMNKALSHIGTMFGLGGSPLSDVQTGVLLMNNCIWIVLALLFCAPIVPLFSAFASRLDEKNQRILLWLQPAFNLLLLGLCTALLVGQSYNPFLYFKF